MLTSCQPMRTTSGLMTRNQVRLRRRAAGFPRGAPRARSGAGPAGAGPAGLVRLALAWLGCRAGPAGTTLRSGAVAGPLRAPGSGSVVTSVPGVPAALFPLAGAVPRARPVGSSPVGGFPGMDRPRS